MPFALWSSSQRMSFAKVEKAAAAYFPHNYQWVLATVGGLTGVVSYFKIKKDLKPPALPVKASASAPAAAGAHKYGLELPTIATLDAWAAKDDNWKAYEKFVADPVRFGAWEKDRK